jgi:hypothetical protein
MKGQRNSSHRVRYSRTAKFVAGNGPIGQVPAVQPMFGQRVLEISEDVMFKWRLLVVE